MGFGKFFKDILMEAKADNNINLKIKEDDIYEKKHNVIIPSERNEIKTEANVSEQSHLVSKIEKKKYKEIKIEEIRLATKIKYDEKSSNRVDKYLFVLYSIIFIFLIFSQINVSLNNNCYNNLKTLFNFSDSNTSRQIILGEVVDSILSTVNTEKFQVISNIRINKRSAMLENDIDKYFDNLNEKLWKILEIDINDPYDSENEENYTNNPFDSDPEKSYHGNGGNYILVDHINTQNYTTQKLINYLTKFYTNNTCVITIDFITLNNEINFLHSFLFKYTFDVTGYKNIEFILNYIDLSTYDGSGTSNFRIIIEIIFFFLVLFYCAVFVYDIKKKGDLILQRYCEIIENQRQIKIRRINSNEISKQNTIESTEHNDNGMTILESYIYSFLSDFFINVFLLVSLIFSIVCMIYWYQYSLTINSIKSTFQQNNSNILISPIDQNRVVKNGEDFQRYINCVSWNFLFLFLKLLKYVSAFVPKTQIIFRALRLASNDIASFFILFFQILLAFIFMVMIFYGKSVSDLSTISNTIQIFFTSILGTFDRNITKKMIDFSNFSVILIIFQSIILRSIFLRILLAIIMYYFKISLDRYDSEMRNKIGNVNTMEKAKDCYQKNELVRYANQYNLWVNKVWDYLLCKNIVSSKNKDWKLKRNPQFIRKKSKSPSINFENDDANFENIKATEEIENHIKNIDNNKSDELKIPPEIREEEKSKNETMKVRSKNSSIDISNVEARRNNNKKISLMFKKTVYMISHQEMFEKDTFENNEEDINSLLDINFGLKHSKKVQKNKKKNELSKKDKKNEEDLDLEEQLDKLPKDFENFNISFSESYILKRDKYFESEKDSDKLNSYYEKKYTSIFKEVFWHLIYLICLILLLFFNSLPSWRYLFYSKIGDSLYQLEINNTINNSVFSISNNLIKIGKFDEVAYFSFKSVLDLFVKGKDTNYYYSNMSSLIQNSYLITVRQAVKNNNFDNYLIPIRLFQDINHDSLMKFQNKSKLEIFNNSGISYFTNDSYGGIGGTSVIVNISNINIFTDDFQAKLINHYTTNVIIEFLAFVDDFKLINYNIIYVDIDFGGLFKTSYNSFYIRVSETMDQFDYLEYICEAIFLMIYCYYFQHEVFKVLEKNRVYDRWEKDQILLFNDQTKKFRNRVKPEFLRKLEYIFDLNKLNDFIFITLNIYFISLKCNIYYNKYLLMKLLNNMNNESLFLLRNKVFNHTQYSENLDTTGSVLLILLSLKFLYYFNNGNTFSILTSTIEHSTTNNMIFILIIFLIQPAFVLFGYLSFGYDLYDFSTVAESIITCLRIYFRTFNYPGYVTASYSMGPVFFYLYLILLNGILQNFFMAILDRSYVRNKILLMNSKENFSIKKIIFSCCSKKIKVEENNNKGIDIENEFEDKNKYDIPEIKLFLHSKIHSAIDYSRDEVENIKIINESLFKLQNKFNNMKKSYVTKQIGGESNIFDDNVYNEIELKHIKCFSFFNINTVTKLISQLETDIHVIEYYRQHLINFKNKQDFKNETDKLKEKNEMFLKEIETKELELSNLLKELENVRSLEEKFKKFKEEQSHIIC